MFPPTQIPDTGSLREEGFLLGHQFRQVSVHHGEESLPAGASRSVVVGGSWWQATVHVVLIRRQRRRLELDVTFIGQHPVCASQAHLIKIHSLPKQCFQLQINSSNTWAVS